MRTFKYFRFQITARIVLLALTLLIFTYALLLVETPLPYSVCALLAVYQIVILVRYLERSNRSLARFLEAIRYADFSQSFPSDTIGPGFSDLNKAFSDIMNEFRRYRMAREEQYRYLRTVLQHVGVGVISFRPDGQVDLINSAAKRLLKVVDLVNIHSLAPNHSELLRTLLTLEPGKKALVKMQDQDDQTQLSISTTGIRLHGEKFTLASLQDIHGELEEKETEAWQSLVRVLTHEIMNSITPISSLASTISSLLESARNGQGHPGTNPRFDETLSDISQALTTIQKRSEGLMQFVQAYRSLTLIPKPKFKIVALRELFLHISSLLQPRFRESGINFTSKIEPESLELTADPQLIEQVLINLLGNAIDAVKGLPESQIELRAEMNRQGRVLVSVADNGPGIIPDAIDKVFIPFFTTKKDGSGIGLSFSRQVMRLHHGNIRVQSTPNVRTVFTLRF